MATKLASLLLLVGLFAALAPSHVSAVEGRDLARLQAPAAAELRQMPAGPKQAVKFARGVIRLRPEPWARVRPTPYYVGEKIVGGQPELLTWEDGQVEFETSLVAQIVNEELRAAGVPVDGSGESLFGQETSADLALGVTIIGMQASFCQGCTGILKIGPRWSGAVVQTARWEIYSGRERRVVATVITDGGYATPKDGLSGAPSQLVYNALRDNTRRLIASDDFRRVIMTDPGAGLAQAPPSPTAAPIRFMKPPETRRTVASASDAVAAIFAGDGHGSGFLISSDGYLLTNRHVVGGAKYVKVRFADGTESLGEVVRSDNRRDVALVKVSPGRQAPLVLRTPPAAVGEAVFAVGTPLDPKFQGTVTKGIVSATRTYEGLPYIQSDVVINGGNSGGPLLDEAGAVIGICVSGMEINGAPVGINLFIPIDDALKALALTPAS